MSPKPLHCHLQAKLLVRGRKRSVLLFCLHHILTPPLKSRSRNLLLYCIPSTTISWTAVRLDWCIREELAEKYLPIIWNQDAATPSFLSVCKHVWKHEGSVQFCPNWGRSTTVERIVINVQKPSRLFHLDLQYHSAHMWYSDYSLGSSNNFKDLLANKKSFPVNAENISY